ncbi:MAG: ribosome biogenesis GTPase Der [Bacilli bacterium]|nr:ribosome biogenesis GTPase Der [Bacilli bacterium]
MDKPTVALVGSPNVGKSTIFNRLIGVKQAIIEDTPGVTRDRIYGTVNYKNYSFHLIDTGGIDMETGDFNKEIKGQAMLAIDESDVVVFVVDGKEGLTANDHIVKEMLMKSGKEVVVAINKADTKSFKDHIYDFYELGFNSYVQLSGEQNFGIEDLLDEITKDFKPYTKEEDNDKVKFSIIGRPNVGKSSLVNALLNEERVIVSDVAGTTRDAVDTEFTYHSEKFIVIDTAGMRKRGKVYETVEKYSLLRSLRAIDRSNVCVIVLDAVEGITIQDKHIAGYAIEAGKAVVLVVNKWDQIEDKDRQMKEFTKEIRNNFAFMPYARIVFLSALTKKRVHTLMPMIIKANENAHKEIKTSLLNNVIMDAYSLNLPPTYKNRRLKIYFASQVDTCPPTFNIQVNSKGLLHFSYKRYLENKIRENFDFEGTPIVLNFKNKGEDQSFD